MSLSTRICPVAAEPNGATYSTAFDHRNMSSVIRSMSVERKEADRDDMRRREVVAVEPVYGRLDRSVRH